MSPGASLTYSKLTEVKSNDETTQMTLSQWMPSERITKETISPRKHLQQVAKLAILRQNKNHKNLLTDKNQGILGVEQCPGACQMPHALKVSE